MRIADAKYRASQRVTDLHESRRRPIKPQYNLKMLFLLMLVVGVLCTIGPPIRENLDPQLTAVRHMWVANREAAARVAARNAAERQMWAARRKTAAALQSNRPVATDYRGERITVEGSLRRVGLSGECLLNGVWRRYHVCPDGGTTIDPL